MTTLNQYIVSKEFVDPIEGKRPIGSTVSMTPERGAKLAKQGYVSLVDEYVKELVKLRWVNERLEIYNTLTGVVLLAVPGTGLTSLTLDIVGNVTGNVVGNVVGDLAGNTDGLNLGTVTTYAVDGAISATDRVAILDGALATCVMTLPDGAEGQEIIVKAIDVTEVCSVAPTNLKDGTIITFTDQYSAVRLVFDGTDWNVTGIYLTVAVA